MCPCERVHSSAGLGPGRPTCGLGGPLTSWLALSRSIRALRVLTVLGPLCGQSQEMYVGIEEHRNQHTHTHIHTDGYYSNICLLIFKTVSL